MAVKTYNPKKILISLDKHAVSGYAEDSFVIVEKNGEGISKQVGCDGEIVRCIDPDGSYKIRLSLLQTSPTNAFLQNQYNIDEKTGKGNFAILISDLRGDLEFSSEVAWVNRPAKRIFGQKANKVEWEIETGEASLDN